MVVLALKKTWPKDARTFYGKAALVNDYVKELEGNLGKKIECDKLGWDIALRDLDWVIV